MAIWAGVDFLTLENTSYYFYSTLAQAFAAITAIIYVASQTRIKYFEDEINAIKKSILYLNYGHSHYTGFQVDKEMNKQSAIQVIEANKNKDGAEFKMLSEKLQNRVNRHNETIIEIRKFVFGGIFLTGLGIIGITLIPTIIKFPVPIQYSAMAFISGFSIYQLFMVKKFVENSFQPIK